MFQRVNYEDLNSRQKENYNFHKVAAELANYGFNCIRLSDDWQGADFIACHINGDTFLKVQLKGRLTVSQKYSNKNVHIAFNSSNKWYLYPHDTLRDELLNLDLIRGSKSWDSDGEFHWPKIPKHLQAHMEKYAIKQN